VTDVVLTDRRGIQRALPGRFARALCLIAHAIRR
jgi:hypothetical protein